MKKFLILFILPFLLFSCAGLKKTSKSDVKTDVKTDIGIEKKIDLQETTNLTTTKSIETDKKTESKDTKKKVTETTVTDFDTSKPIDAKTGKPPTAKETRTVEHEVSENETKTTDNSIEKLNLQIEANKKLKQTAESQKSEIRKLKSALETKEEPKLTWWQISLMWCGGAFLILLAIAIYKKIKPFI